jgi:hypothetical protein
VLYEIITFDLNVSEVFKAQKEGELVISIRMIRLEFDEYGEKEMVSMRKSSSYEGTITFCGCVISKF